MVTIKALVPFVGEVSMNTGDTREVSEETAKDLIGAGYAEKVGGKAEPKAEAKPKAKKGDKS